jgi:hypothetical protein
MQVKQATTEQNSVISVRIQKVDENSEQLMANSSAKNVVEERKTNFFFNTHGASNEAYDKNGQKKNRLHLHVRIEMQTR